MSVEERNLCRLRRMILRNHSATGGRVSGRMVYRGYAAGMRESGIDWFPP